MQTITSETSQVVRCLFEAPPMLRGRVSDEHQRILPKKGTAIRGEDAAIERDYEIAVHVGKVSRLRAVAAEVARFLKCEPAGAVELLCSSPAILPGRYSEAAVEQLRECLQPLGAEVDSSRVGDALYHIHVGSDQQLRARVAHALAQAGVPIEPTGPLVALAVPRHIALSLLNSFGGDPSFRLLNRAFQRFDVELEASPDTPDARACIASASGLPATLVPKVLDQLPVVVASAKRWEQAAEALMCLAEVGALANAHLVTLASYDVEIEQMENRRAAADVLASLTDHDAAEIEAMMGASPVRVPGPFGQVKAQWITHELGQVGAQASIVER